MEWAEVSWHVQETQSLRAQTLQHRFIAITPQNNKQLVEILSYHVVPGVAAYSDAVIKMREVPTLLGTPIAVKVVNGKGR
jgi:uncharacterized surface protein with fasciclin (FAS1) repeats